MIVSCPACESRFQVDQEQLGYNGRIVRCGKCGNCWHQMPEEDPRTAAAELPGPPPRPQRRPAPVKRRSGRGAAAGWVLLLLFVAGLGAAGWLERGRIVAEFPQMAEAYALVGLPIEPPGPVLQLNNVDLSSEVVEGTTVIIVRGVVSNISERKQAIPPLRAQLTDSAGEVLAEWTFDSPQTELDAGSAVAFQTETRNPPDGAQNLSISFVGGAP